MEINKLISQNIKYVREIKGIKQDKIAFILDTTQSYISAIEGNRTKISFSRLEEIAKILGVEPYILLKPNLKADIEKKIWE